MKLWIWRNLRTEVPDNWDLSSCDPHPDSGSCSFYDGIGFQPCLEMRWQQLYDVPDLPDRMDQMLAAHMRLQASNVDERRRIDGWEGMAGLTDDGRIHCYSNWFADLHCLVDLKFLWRGDVDHALERQIIRSVQRERNVLNLQRWRAFGIDLRAPERMTLEGCSRSASRTEFTFVEAPHGFEYSAGTVKGAAPAAIAAFIRSKWPRGARLYRQEARQVLDHGVVTLIAKVTENVLPWPLSQRHTWIGSAWYCPNSGQRFLKWRQVEGPPSEGVVGWVGEHLPCCRQAGRRLPALAHFRPEDARRALLRQGFERHIPEPTAGGAPLLDEFIRARWPVGATLYRTETAKIMEHGVTSIVAAVNDVALPWPLRRRSTWVGSAWVCPHDQHRYLFWRQEARAPGEWTSGWLADRLRCCDTILNESAQGDTTKSIRPRVAISADSLDIEHMEQVVAMEGHARRTREKTRTNIRPMSDEEVKKLRTGTHGNPGAEADRPAASELDGDADADADADGDGYAAPAPGDRLQDAAAADAGPKTSGDARLGD